MNAQPGDFIVVGRQGVDVVVLHREDDGDLSIRIARDASLDDLIRAARFIARDALDRLLPPRPADPHTGAVFGPAVSCHHEWPCEGSVSPHCCVYGKGHSTEYHHCPCGERTAA